MTHVALVGGLDTWDRGEYVVGTGGDDMVTLIAAGMIVGGFLPALWIAWEEIRNIR